MKGKGEGHRGGGGGGCLTIVRREADKGSNIACLHKREADEGFADFDFSQCSRGLLQA